MSFEPQKFFIGLVDFFSIFLPGALLTYVLMDSVGPDLLGFRYKQLVGAQGWVAFLFSSYLLGHFVFLLGSWLLDDYCYDPIRKTTDRDQVKRLADGKRTSPRLLRWLARRIFRITNDSNRAVDQAVRIKEKYLEKLEDYNAINAFQWCKARLLDHPEALSSVHRYEADSKFFRSLVIVTFTLLIWGVIILRLDLILVSLLLFLLSFWRYIDQRLKATNQAYWNVITLEGDKYVPKESPRTKKGEPTHAGGVVFRRKDKQLEYLLVQAKKDPKDWVLPKGHIEPDEKKEVTAVREVHEETGVWARIRKELGVVSFTANREFVRCQFYLMEGVRAEVPKDRGREHEWLTFQEAHDRLVHPESKDLFKKLQQARTKK